MSDSRRNLERRLALCKPALLVSLPRNDMDLAKAAVAGGAEGLKVHINVDHYASGTHFGSLAEERGFIEQVVGLGLPVGIVPGADELMASAEDMKLLDEIGVDFFDAYVHDMPAWMLSLPGRMSVMVALSARQMNSGFDLGTVSRMAQMIEASICTHDGYGQRLNVADIAQYSQIAVRYPHMPVVVPTQRLIIPEDIPTLAGAGVRALLIGAIVTGKDAAGIETTTAGFRTALDAL